MKKMKGMKGKFENERNVGKDTYEKKNENKPGKTTVFGHKIWLCKRQKNSR
jgi:hypothetical protein